MDELAELSRIVSGFENEQFDAYQRAAKAAGLAWTWGRGAGDTVVTDHAFELLVIAKSVCGVEPPKSITGVQATTDDTIRAEIIRVVSEHPDGLTPTQIAAAIDSTATKEKIVRLAYVLGESGAIIQRNRTHGNQTIHLFYPDPSTIDGVVYGLRDMAALALERHGIIISHTQIGRRLDKGMSALEAISTPVSKGGRKPGKKRATNGLQTCNEQVPNAQQTSSKHATNGLQTRNGGW